MAVFHAKCTFETFFTTCSEFSRSPFGGLLGPSGTIFTSIFTPIFTQISHNFHTLGGEAIWSLSGHALGEASPAARHCALHGYLDRFCSPQGARLAKMREVPRIMRHPAHSHRLHSVCVAICCRMVPLTWWLHPGPAPRCVTTAAPQSENSREIFGPTEILGARRRQKKGLAGGFQTSWRELAPPHSPIDS